ncbi:16576_t:CDS:2, partial [Cetraspora pellucida]
GIVTSSSNAIISVYQAIFGTKTKFASLSYLGLEQIKTSQKLLEDVVFYPFIIEVENLSIFVSSFDKISHSNQKTIVYQNSQIVAEYKDNSPNAVWCQTGILKSIPGDTLFAINHLITLQKLDQAYQTNQILTPNQCTLVNWNNKAVMKHLFDIHLKKANEFWTNTLNLEKDHNTLKNLYENEILNVSPQTSTTKAFWDCFYDSYNINLRETNDQDNIEISSELLNHQLEADISKKKIKTIPDISKWFEWSWPVMGQFAGYIRAHSLLHIGVWTEFRPEQIATFYNRPSPIFSKPSKPKSAWTMPIPKKTAKEQRNRQYVRVDQDFPFNAGWDLKENMKLGKKGAGKHISKKVVQYLQGFFLAGNLNANDHYSPEAMHTSLKELAENEELTFEEIPSVKTIKG